MSCHFTVLSVKCTDVKLVFTVLIYYIAVVQKDLNKYGLPDGTMAVVNLSGENLMNPAKRQVPLFA